MMNSNLRGPAGPTRAVSSRNSGLGVLKECSQFGETLRARLRPYTIDGRLLLIRKVPGKRRAFHIKLGFELKNGCVYLNAILMAHLC